MNLVTLVQSIVKDKVPLAAEVDNERLTIDMKPAND